MILSTYFFMSLNMILLVSLFIISIIAPLGHALWVDRTQKQDKNLLKLYIKYGLFFNVGCLFLLGFAGHLVYGPEIARCLNWNFSPFQYELSFSELALAVLGLFCGLFNHHFWLATIIASSVWLVGASGVQFYSDLVHGTSVVAQGAFVGYWNIFITLWLIGLYVVYKRGCSLRLVDWMKRSGSTIH